MFCDIHEFLFPDYCPMHNLYFVYHFQNRASRSPPSQIIWRWGSFFINLQSLIASDSAEIAPVHSFCEIGDLNNFLVKSFCYGLVEFHRPFPELGPLVRQNMPVVLQLLDTQSSNLEAQLGVLSNVFSRNKQGLPLASFCPRQGPSDLVRDLGVSRNGKDVDIFQGGIVDTNYPGPQGRNFLFLFALIVLSGQLEICLRNLLGIAW